ncbi:hypothetical protein [Algoriphagus persicinus]|nr:hypothetical protein [Algoriphagus sp. E1-3-M2]MEB2786432.1 hypothetical protein [Algoriphagus sp. E1-3-M2]
MKSSMTRKSHTGMIIMHARFSRIEFGTGYPVSFVTGQVMALKKKL